jgi:hypothetical protein
MLDAAGADPTVRDAQAAETAARLTFDRGRNASATRHRSSITATGPDRVKDARPRGRLPCLHLMAATALFVLYFVIRKAVFHAILDADMERAEYARQVREPGQPLPDAPPS